ncbi:MAG: lysylphosphatidylglycerol synthase transmembrane domain-containing protein [Phycisphaerae bacterium]|nr:lysylphosphatidylglycerol synthase transmembrane domain-containing protein [Phycisphaerae bacterium]
MFISSKKMIRYIKNIAAFLIIAFLLWYLKRNWLELKAIMRLSAWDITFIFTISVFGVFNTAFVHKILLNGFGIRAKFWDMFLLQNASYLLNYAPMKFGTLFKASFLKKHYNLGYLKFTVFFMYLTFVMILTTSLVGLFSLLLKYDIHSVEVKVLMLVYFLFLVISSILIFVPISLPDTNNIIVKKLKIFFEARSELIAYKKNLFYSVALLNLNYLLTAVRLGIIFNSLDQNIHPAGYLILGSVGYFLMFISLTPGALGIREIVIGAASVVIGLPLNIGILAAVIDRAVMIIYSFIIGGFCSIYLWRKSPEDFENVNISDQPQNKSRPVRCD